MWVTHDRCGERVAIAPLIWAFSFSHATSPHTVLKLHFENAPAHVFILDLSVHRSLKVSLLDRGCLGRSMQLGSTEGQEDVVMKAVYSRWLQSV